ncbi:MAG: hypothetical protein FWC13_08430 [Oscillospiraceae bacterium]|nr:hypothetical protein [Oscillospiraceae bacterium]
MATKKVIDRKITTHKERMKQMATELKNLEKLQKAEDLKLQAVRNTKRGAIFEKKLTDTVALDDVHFAKLVDWISANEYVKKFIAKLSAEQAKFEDGAVDNNTSIVGATPEQSTSAVTKPQHVEAVK